MYGLSLISVINSHFSGSFVVCDLVIGMFAALGVPRLSTRRGWRLLSSPVSRDWLRGMGCRDQILDDFGNSSPTTCPIHIVLACR